MSRQPTPRMDQLRALREANFARAEQRQKEAERAARAPGAATSRDTAPVANEPVALKPAQEAAAKPAAPKKKSAPKPAAKKAAKTESDKTKSAKTKRK